MPIYHAKVAGKPSLKSTQLKPTKAALGCNMHFVSEDPPSDDDHVDSKASDALSYALFTPNWKATHTVHSISHSALHDLLNRHAGILWNESGTVSSTSAKLHLEPQSQPHVCHARTIAYTVQAKIEKELDYLQELV